MSGQATSIPLIFLTLDTFLERVGIVFEAATGWIGTIVGVVMDNPILLVLFTLGFGFTVIRMFKALR